MNKGEQTKERIISEATALINQKGFHGMSMADLMSATGLEKGGLYRHFKTKEEIVCAAFAHYVSLVAERLREALEGIESPRERLAASIRSLSAIARDPVVKGGCMVMNLGIESDFTNSTLRDLTRDSIQQWASMIRRETVKAITCGEFDSKTDPESLATLIISSIEGAIMMSNVCGDPIHADRVMAHLEDHLAHLSP